MQRAEPELALAVRARFEATKHHVLATLRSDGAPRVSGTEVIIGGDVLALGSMWRAVKALDLRRDGRFALHSNPGDGSMEGGDAKVSGTAVELGGELAVAIAAGLPQEACPTRSTCSAWTSPRWCSPRSTTSATAWSSARGRRPGVWSWPNGDPGCGDLGWTSLAQELVTSKPSAIATGI